MTPNLLMTLDIEPHTLMWNGQAVSLPGTYELVPDEMVKHLHRRVMAIALHERKKDTVLREIGRAGAQRERQGVRLAHRGRPGAVNQESKAGSGGGSMKLKFWDKKARLIAAFSDLTVDEAREIIKAAKKGFTLTRVGSRKRKAKEVRENE